MSTRSNRSTPRKRRSARSGRSPKYTPRRREEVTSRRRSTSTPRDRSSKSKSSSRYKRRSSTPKAGRSSRKQSYSPQYRDYDVDHKEELCTSDNERQRERVSSHPSRGKKSRRSSRGDDRRERRKSDSNFWSKECKASEVWPDCRLRDIKASGGSRDFKKWFDKVPPNCRVDKDVRTDRGMFRKDNFESTKALDRYLGINKSKSPTDRSRRWGRE